MKKKFEEFNDINIDLEEYEGFELTKDEKDNIKSRLKGKMKDGQATRNKKQKRVFAAAMAFMLLGSTALFNDGVRASISRLGREIESFFEKEEGSLGEYKVEVNKVVEDHGIKVTLKEIMLNGSNMVMSLNVDESEFIKNNPDFDYENKYLPSISDVAIKIDSVEFKNNGSSIEGKRKNDDGTQDFLVTIELNTVDIDGDGVAETGFYDFLSNLDLRKPSDIEVNIFEFHTLPKAGGFIGEENRIAGSWDFSTSLDLSQMYSDTQVFEINEELSIKDGDYEESVFIERVEVSPLTVKLVYRKVIGDGINKYENGTLENGDLDRALDLEIRDQDGKALPGGAGGGGELMTYEWELKKNTTGLKIVPYVNTYKVKKSIDENGNVVYDSKFRGKDEYMDKSIDIILDRE